ncbi:hypothetical protein VTK56DRAFT_5587 [Thermocarpiscus australiensis]
MTAEDRQTSWEEFRCLAGRRRVQGRSPYLQCGTANDGTYTEYAYTCSAFCIPSDEVDSVCTSSVASGCVVCFFWTPAAGAKVRVPCDDSVFGGHVEPLEGCGIIRPQVSMYCRSTFAVDSLGVVGFVGDTAQWLMRRGFVSLSRKMAGRLRLLPHFRVR